MVGLLGAWFLLSPASATEHTRADLAEGSDRAARIVLACRARPDACADPEAREALARAFFTLVVDAVVNGRPVDPEHAANVGVLDPALSRDLPIPAASTPTPWVVRLTDLPVSRAPNPRPAPAPTPEPEVAPEPALPVDLPTALALLGRGDLEGATTRLNRLATAGDRDAALALATAAEQLALPATSLVLRSAWLRADPDDPRVRGLSAEAVRLAAATGSRQALVELALAVHPSAWDPAVQPDGWLALGQTWQQRGDFSRALQAFAEVDRRSAAHVRARYQVGLIRWQTGRPWEALAAFRDAWEAEADEVDVERIRELALWNVARLYEELGRGEDALAHYEVLSITASPLSERAAHRCAQVALAEGDTALAARWLGTSLPHGVFRPDDDLLRARLALAVGDRSGADARLDRADRDLRALDQELVAILADRGGAWSLLRDPDRLPAAAARLDADPELAGLRAHLSAARAERRALAAWPDPTWRADVGAALDRKLRDHELAVVALAEATATARLVEVRSELAALRRQVDAQRDPRR